MMKKISIKTKLMLAITSNPNFLPGQADEFRLENLGSEPEIGTIYIDANPGELHSPILFIYEQTQPAKLIRGEAPSMVFDAYFEPIPVPTPRTFTEIIAKMNEGEFLSLGVTEKGICNVTQSRRARVLQYLGFDIEE